MARESPLVNEHPTGTAYAIVGDSRVPMVHESVNADYDAIRSGCALIDHHALGIITVSGADANAAVDRACAREVRSLHRESTRMTLMLDEEGRVIDSVVLSRISDGFRLETSTGRCSHVQQNVISALSADVDVTHEFCILGLEGPTARRALAQLLAKRVSLIPFQAVAEATLHGRSVIVMRTGYTGEFGFKLYVPVDLVGDVWQLLCASGARPAGHEALEIAMLEIRQPVIRLETWDGLSVTESGFDWLVDPTKGTFSGRQALLEQHEVPAWSSVSFVANGNCTKGARIVVGDVDIGYVAVASFSPGLGKPFGLARLRRPWAVAKLGAVTTNGAEVELETRSSPLVFPASWSVR